MLVQLSVEQIAPRCAPLGPDNKLIMATGPLTGTTASTGGRYSVITKSPLTGTVACSNSGGFIGAEMKNAGWDMIIFEGKSPEPVYLYLENDKAELRSAADLWGKSVWETDELLHKAHQDPQLRIACVGRSAEAGCLYAAVVNDLHRAAGRSGVGTVMASKHLKAVAIRGLYPHDQARHPCDQLAGHLHTAVTDRQCPYPQRLHDLTVARRALAEQRGDQFVQFDESLTVSGEGVSCDQLLDIPAIGEATRRVGTAEQQRQVAFEQLVGQQPCNQVSITDRQYRIGAAQINPPVVLPGMHGSPGADSGPALDAVEHRAQLRRIGYLDAHGRQQADAVESRAGHRLDTELAEIFSAVASLEFGKERIQHVEQLRHADGELARLLGRFDLPPHTFNRRTLRGQLSGIVIAEAVAQVFGQQLAGDERVRGIGGDMLQQPICGRFRRLLARDQQRQRAG